MALNHRSKLLRSIKIKIHSSCEIEDFVETHLFCKLCMVSNKIGVASIIAYYYLVKKLL